MREREKRERERERCLVGTRDGWGRERERRL
jgi:hypothetical protein